MFKKKKFFEIFVFIIYALITFFLACKHEIWQDEAQAWLIARDLSPVGIFKQMWYEGHPCLWHLILMPFAKLGFPSSFMPFISWFLMLLTVFLFLKYINFPKVFKLIICFSEPFLWHYSVISRCYSLIPLLFILISIFYKKRHDYLILYTFFLCLLANTHILMLGPSFILYVCLFVESVLKKEKNKVNIFISVGLYCTSILCLCAQIIPAYFNCVFVQSSGFNSNSLFRVLNGFYQHLLFKPSNNYSYFASFSFLAFILMVVFLIRNLKMCLLLVGSCIFFIIIHVNWSFLAFNHVYLLFLIIIFCYGVVFNDKKFFTKFIMFITILYISIFSYINNFSKIKTDIFGNYTAGLITASFIDNNLEDDSIFISINNARDLSVIASIKSKKIKFFTPIFNEYYTYYTWKGRSSSPWYTKESLIDLIKFMKLKGKHVYIINIEEITQSEYINNIVNDLLSLKAIREIFFGFGEVESVESFKIYEISDDFFKMQNIDLLNNFKFKNKKDILRKKLFYIGVDYYMSLNI